MNSNRNQLSMSRNSTKSGVQGKHDAYLEMANAPLKILINANNLLTDLLDASEEFTNLLYGLRKSSKDPYDMNLYDLSEYEFKPANVIYSPASLDHLLRHPSTAYAVDTEYVEFVFNFVYGFHSTGQKSPAFVFGSRQTQQGDGPIHDSIVEKGVKHFHLSSSKNIIPVFAGVMHVKIPTSHVTLPIRRQGRITIDAVDQGHGQNSTIVSITPLSGRWMGIRDALTKYLRERGNLDNLNEFNSEALTKLARLGWSKNDYDYLLDSFSSIEVCRLLEKKWKKGSNITYKPCLIQALSSLIKQNSYSSVCSMDIPDYVHLVLPRLYTHHQIEEAHDRALHDQNHSLRAQTSQHITKNNASTVANSWKGAGKSSKGSSTKSRVSQQASHA